MKLDCPTLLIKNQNIDQLKPSPHNARIHSKRQIRQIADSIRAFGFTNPVLVDRSNRIAAGHGRVEAAKLLSMTQVPTIILDELTDDQLRAYILADNQLGLRAEWNFEMLATELKYLNTLEGSDFDPTVTGFELPEIDCLIEGLSESTRDDPDDQLPELAQKAVARTGDLWELGKHRILCGSAIEDSSYAQLLGVKRASVAFLDVPYNQPINGHVSGNGRIRHREFAMASGEMSEAEFTSFLTSSFAHAAQYSKLASVHYICIDWPHLAHVFSAGSAAYDALLNVCVWVKNKAGMGSGYRSRHEMICVYRNGKGKYRNNIQLGKFGRDRSNVWEYPSISSTAKTGEDGNLLALHPTVKPVALIKDALLDCSARNEIVLDSFLGSGSTLIAAERTGRICYGMELDPLYIDTAIRRWQRHTGGHAIHTESRKRFDEIAHQLRGDKCE